MTKKQIRNLNKKYIEEVKRKSVFPETFLYSKLIDIVKENFKDFFIDPKDLVQNNNGQINRKKGGKRTVSQAAYEFGEGYFDLKYDSRIGIRTSANSKDKKKVTSTSNISKPNHFWWLISKVYLNKFLLEDARRTVKEFMSLMQKNNEAFSENPEDQKPIKDKTEALFNAKCLDFPSLLKNDPDLDMIKVEDLEIEKSFPAFPLLDDKLWDM